MSSSEGNKNREQVWGGRPTVINIAGEFPGLSFLSIYIIQLIYHCLFFKHDAWVVEAEDG